MRQPNSYQSYQPSGNAGPPPHTSKTPPPGMQRKPLPGLQTQTSPPVHRKPLPQRNDSLQSAGASSRNGSMRSHPDDGTPLSPSTSINYHDPILDEVAFQLVDSPELQRRDYENYVQQQPRQRQMTMRSEASSNYDDGASTASPDYASTRKSSETQESFERPRAGVLKTVGDTASSDSGSHVEVPDINFGPTLNLANGRNVSRGPWVPPISPAAQPPRPYSPGGARKTPTVMTPTANITPSTGEIGHFRTESEDTLKRRSVAWQPGVAIGGGAQDAVSPEEFVAQRAAAAAASSNPRFAHQRTPSGHTLAQMGTPPLKRTGSQDYLTNRHSRSGSADLLQRRNSQDSTFLLSANGTGAVSSSLSAREQEQIARATGTPLIGMATSKNYGAQPAGLVGAIEAREREKVQLKQGYNSQTVQHAINQRQQQQQYAQQQQQFAQQQQMYGAAPNMSMGNLSNMGMAMGPAAPSMYGGSMGMQSMGMQSMGMQGMGRGGQFSSAGPSRAATLSPPPVGMPGNIGPMNPMGPTRAQSPGPRFMSPPPLQGGGQYPPQSPGFGQPMQYPTRMQSPGPQMRMASPGPGAGPMRMASPGPQAGPMRMASPGPGTGPMRMASPGPGNVPMRMASPGPGVGPMRMASPGPGRQLAMPPPGQYSMHPGQPGTPGAPRSPYQGQAF